MSGAVHTAYRPGAAAPAAEQPGPSRQQVLAWAFTLFNSLRLLAYVPMAWAVMASGNSGQHSLWTWFIWLGANLTMAGWLHDSNGRRCNRAVVFSVCNAAMCFATLAVVLWYR